MKTYLVAVSGILVLALLPATLAASLGNTRGEADDAYEKAVDETLLKALEAAVIKTSNKYNRETFDALVDDVIISATKALILKTERQKALAASVASNQKSAVERALDSLTSRRNKDNLPPPFSRREVPGK